MTEFEKEVMAAAKAEISRLAASAYSEDGVSLYDHIRLTSRDEEELRSYMSNVMETLRVRFKGKDIPWPESSSFPDTIATSVDVNTLATYYFVYSICAEWFRRKYVAKYEEYAAKAKAALENLVILVKTRKEPTKGGIKL